MILLLNKAPRFPGKSVLKSLFLNVLLLMKFRWIYMKLQKLMSIGEVSEPLILKILFYFLCFLLQDKLLHFRAQEQNLFFQINVFFQLLKFLAINICSNVSSLFFMIYIGFNTFSNPIGTKPRPPFVLALVSKLVITHILY